MSPKKQTSLLKYTGSNALPVIADRNVLLKCAILRDQLWNITELLSYKNEECMVAQPPFEYVSSKSSGVHVPLDHHKYATPFLDHEGGDDLFINPSSIIRMRIERGKAPGT